MKSTTREENTLKLRAERSKRIEQFMRNIGPCHLCKTSDFGKSMPHRVEEGLIAGSYFVNLPDKTVVCDECFKCAVDGHVPDVTLTKAYTVKCQVCQTMFPPAGWVGLKSNQGDHCSVFWDKSHGRFHGCWGSYKFDMDRIEPTPSFPTELLDTLDPLSQPICDDCMSTWAQKGWILDPHTGGPFK